MYHIGWFGTLWNIKNEMGVNIELNNLFANGNESKRVEEWKFGEVRAYIVQEESGLNPEVCEPRGGQ